MLDIIKLPLIGLKESGGTKYSGTWMGILLLGIVSGLVAAPCATPVLGSILTLVAVNVKNMISGAILLFIYGFGLGTLLILVGTFSGLASNLPKSGRWMDILKKIFGIMIILAGLYFLLFKGFHLF
jgi:cytochrome c-type biogenesis protein